MEPTEPNRRAFDAAHLRRRGERSGLPPIVKTTLGDLTAKRVLHLQAGTGEASADLAEQGAVVTAVDPSEAALEAAREQWPKILWIQAAAQALPGELRRGRFDLVYSPPGVVAQLTDLNAWARGIADALHERGELLVYDDHPVALCVDAFRRWQHDYFGEGLWRLGSIVTALARARLRVEALEEYPGERRVPGTFLLYASRRSE
jgi:SAM-dependent methyltransferase